MRIKLNTKTLIYSYTTAGVLIVVLIGLLFFASHKEDDAQRLVKHSGDVAKQIAVCSSAFDDTENISRELFNFGRTGGNLFVAREKAFEEFLKLKELVKDNRSQDANIDLFEFSIKTRFETVDRLIKAYNAEGIGGVTNVVQTGNTIADIKRVTSSRDFIQREEARLLDERTGIHQKSRWWVVFFIRLTVVLLAFSLIASACLSFHSIKKEKRANQLLFTHCGKLREKLKNSALESEDIDYLEDRISKYLDEDLPQKKF